MEVNEKHNVNMIKFVLLCLFMSCAKGRIHKLKLEDDSRKQITLSTFGFLSGGTLAINVTSFSPKLSNNVDLKTFNRTLFGFTLDKSKSPGLSSYMEGMQGTCILNNPTIKNENMQSIFFRFDFLKKRLNIERVGDDMKKLVVSSQSRVDFLTAHDLNRRATENEVVNSKLSDNYLVGSRRKVHDHPNPTPVSLAAGSKAGSVLPGHVQEGGAAGERAGPASKAPPPGATTENKPLSDTAARGKTQPPSVGLSALSAPGESELRTPSKPTATGFNMAASGSEGAADQVPGMNTSTVQGAAAVVEDAELKFVDVAMNEDGTYQSYFLVYVQEPEEEGLYNLFFHNCLSYSKDVAAFIALTVTITEDNNGNFLTAGEMPVPALYFTFSVLFFITGITWLSVLRKSKEDVYKIHYLMLVVVFVKSLACLFHGVNMYFIQITGIHEDAWAILWYIVYLTRGALMFVTVLLIGAGWAFIKHVLTDREKRLFMVVIPLQILDRVAEVIVEESEEGNQSYMTWKEIFILVDLLCCGAILFPVVWSIRHLQEASRTDGKAAINLQKLKLFRHFYILVVCYIYFTRIIVYLMKITLPFKLEWLTDLFTELAMMVFFIVTGSKFRPATDNPYLQVPLDSDDEEIEMEEVLTKTGSTEGVVRVNQKTEGATNQIKQRESSHEYD